VVQEEMRANGNAHHFSHSLPSSTDQQPTSVLGNISNLIETACAMAWVAVIEPREKSVRDPILPVYIPPARPKTNFSIMKRKRQLLLRSRQLQRNPKCVHGNHSLNKHARPTSKDPSPAIRNKSPKRVALGQSFSDSSLKAVKIDDIPLDLCLLTFLT
jgi:hypothetical protein